MQTNISPWLFVLKALVPFSHTDVRFQLAGTKARGWLYIDFTRLVMVAGWGLVAVALVAVVRPILRGLDWNEASRDNSP